MDLRSLGFLLSLSPLACDININDGQDSGNGDTTATDEGGDDAPVCGNDVIEAGEACDSEQLGPISCESLMLGTGSLVCNAQCQIDASGCEDFMGTSGGGGDTATAADTAPADTDTDTGIDTGAGESYGYEGYADSYGDGPGGDTGPLQPVCTQYGQTLAECYGGDATFYAGYCQELFDEYAAYGPACATAVEEVFACLAGTPCRQLGTTCDSEMNAMQAAC